MSRFFSRLLLCGCLVVLGACSKRERSKVDDEEWSDVQPLADKAAVVSSTGSSTDEKVPEVGAPATPLSRRMGQSDAEDNSRFIQRLKDMQTVQRAAGETLLTGVSLVFDYDRRFVRVDENVVVVDDRGELEAETLIGHFSASNKVEYIEAGKGVVIRSEDRLATAENAIYNYQSGEIQLAGHANISKGGSRLSGEQIMFWIKGRRKMVCEPNALLVISSDSGFQMEGVPQSGGSTEIRSDRLVYDEDEAQAVFEGNVRVRDPRAAMNCEKARLYLKENNEIDWIEALSEVIIQSDDRKALADRASYYADEGKFVLEGEPMMKQGQSYMTGDKIEIWLKPIRMVCEPNARTVLYMTEEMKAKFLKDLKD
jgi:lipopolysaccharide transport protein LptA